MQTTQTDDKTFSAATGPDYRPRYIHLGVDAAGASHCYHTPTESVYEIRDGAIRDRRQLGHRSIETYITAVGDERDWDDLRYGLAAQFSRIQVTSAGGDDE